MLFKCGFGFGLLIVCNIVQLYGGEVVVMSVGVGCGMIVMVMLLVGWDVDDLVGQMLCV